MDSHASTATENAEGPNTGDGADPAANLPELTLGSGGPAEESAEPHSAPTIRGRIDKFGTAMGTGRRKTSVARVRIVRGNGKLTINKRTLEDYFRVERNRALVEGPLLATDMLGKVDIWVRAQGGGTTGQVGAIVLGIARALQAMDPGLHPRLSEGNFLTRDGRMVERKKYGRKKARRSFQFSKR
jgi:small subunit ribosomal protein S9